MELYISIALSSFDCPEKLLGNCYCCEYDVSDAFVCRSLSKQTR